MPSPDVLDFAKLLAPIQGSSPSGLDLRANRTPTSPYDQLKDARTVARNAERDLLVPSTPGDTDPVAKKREEDAKKALSEKWPFIRDLAPRVVAENSKDLEICAWLIEALVRRNGYAGLRDGFRLVRQLIETFWDSLYPMPDEEGMATRVSPLTGLNGDESDGTLLIPIRSVPITEKDSDKPITCLSYQIAVEIQSLDEATRKRRMEQGAVSVAEVDKAVADSSPEFFVNLIDDLKQCCEEFEKINGLLQDRCGNSAPPSSNIRNVLEGCLDTVQSVAKDRIAAAAGATADTAAGGASEQSGEKQGGVVVAVGSIRTREDAFRTLSQVAEFFRRNEPHTPVSYALEQVVRWGRMPLPELLGELIPEDSVRSNLFKLVGIKPPSPN